MGKRKQSQRTKNNAVPASSGRSAELLQSTSGVPFVGFTTLKEGGFIPMLSGLNDDLDVNINEDFRLVWKKMNKKDTTTKLKALDEFKKLCQDCDVEKLKPVLPFWPRVYCALSTDEEHRVREAAHTAHRAVVSKAGRNIAPYLKQLVGPWFTGQHDTYAPAASAAQAAFQEAFPPNKLIEAIVFCQEEILNYICDNLLNQTPETLANNQNKNCSEESKDARYERVIVSCLNGYALYLLKLPAEHLHKAEETNRKLITSAKFWKFNKDSAPIVRAAWFTALVALCEKGGFLLRDEDKHVCMAVFTNLEETDPAVVRSLWQAVLLTFTVVNDVWKNVSLEKLVLPKLWKVLREGADGSACLIFPNLLPFLSKLPSNILTDKTKFYSKYFDNLQAGLKVRSVMMSTTESNAVITGFFESIRYLISINSEDHEFCLSLVENQLFPLVGMVLSDPKVHLARPCLFSSLSNQINHWSRQCNPPFISITASFWKWLTAKCEGLLQSNPSDHDILASNCIALQALLAALKTPHVQQRKSLKVKFVSPKKSNDSEEDELSPTVETPSVDLAPTFTSELSQFIDGQFRLCFQLMEECSQQTEAVLVTHLAMVVEEFHSAQVFCQVVSAGGGTWKLLYQRWLAKWLNNDSLLHTNLKIIFTLIQYLEVDSDVQKVYTDLSGGKWQEAVEWALKPQNQTVAVSQWLQSHDGVCRLVSSLTRNHTSYNTLHNSLRNLRQNSWLTTPILGDLVNTLRHNLTNPSVVKEVKICSSDLLEAMLQNAANHSVLARLTTEDIQGLLYELFTATLQHLPHFPEGWHHCITVLTLQSDAHLDTAYNTCVDRLIDVARSRTINLADSHHMVSLLEQLVLAAAQVEESSLADVTLGVVGHLATKAREDDPAVWSLLNVANFVSGSLRDFSPPIVQQGSYYTEDPLSSTPLQQYINTMTPLLELVVRLQTAESQDEGQLLPYAQLKAALPSEDLWDWTLQVLQLHSVCVTVQSHFVNTKQYFLLKDKIMFILEECGLLSQLRVKDLIKRLDLSIFEECSSSLLVNDPLTRLQTQVLLKDLGLLYDVHQIQKELISIKPGNSIVKLNYFPYDALEELSAVSGHLERDQLPTINACCCRLPVMDPDSHTHISILDRVFDQFVAEEKENRSLQALSHQELNHIAEVADFAHQSVSRDFIHLQQSSWDSCLVATAALALSVATTLGDVIPTTSGRQIQTASQPSEQPKPLPLLSDTPSLHKDGVEDSISLPLVRVVCSVCRLFDAVSSHMNSVDPEDKAAVTRSTEWNDVFLPGTHAAFTRAWLAVSELPCDWPARLMLTEALSSSVAQFVHYPHFVLENSTLDSLDTCCRLLQSAQTSVQLTAYQLLLKLTPAMIDLDMKESEKDNVALSCSHVEQALVHTQSIIEVILSELSFGDLCIVEPFTDSYRFTRCYLLLWCALLELCGKASSQLRALYTTWLKEEYLPVFIKAVFCLMPEAARHGELTSQRIAQLFVKAPQFEKGVWGSERLAHLSCWVFACSLRRLPAAIRQWWNEADHKTYGLVNHVTANYISPDVIAEEMRSIQTHQKKLENMTVQIHHTTKEVYAVYTFEESNMELAIELAHNHPLGLVKVRSGQRMVSTTQTRQWLMQITILLTYQNGSVWDALELWKHSVDKRFEGVEECYICFAILHGITHQLPKLSCHTCRKKFHSHCLYKWFTTSHKSTCPICRNMFSPFHK